MPEKSLGINLQELRELIKLLRESNISELEYHKADFSVRIKHGNSEAAIVTTAPVLSTGTVTTASAAVPTGVASSATAEAAPPQDDLHTVRSPMVGTFYRSATPGAASFVEIGDMVRKNQVLCIVEAMKIMNEIESDVDGEVRTIHAANGQPVEYGEPLFSVKVQA
jgi:acetyl-CoA carboxylase biotin carboxyl carrier protein